ncbi:hypothetical protein ACUXST_002514 [Sphingomonas sp. F9_3S_D5_B_2]
MVKHVWEFVIALWLAPAILMGALVYREAKRRDEDGRADFTDSPTD